MKTLREINSDEWNRRSGSRDKLYKMKHRYKLAFKRICSFSPEKWIDIGAGNGFLAEIVKDALPDVHVIGADFAEVALEEATSLDEKLVINLDLEDLPFDENHFDFISCLEVLEHLALREHLLAEMFRVLKPGGHCLISVPNLQFIEYLLALWRGKMPHPAADPRHMSIFTIAFLKKEMKKAGFEIVYTDGCDASPSWFSKISKRYLCKTIMVEGVKPV